MIDELVSPVDHIKPDPVAVNTELSQLLETETAGAEGTTNGDISTLDNVPEDAQIWQQVTSTSDNCLAKD